MKTLRLPLEKKWFEPTKSGVKTEDYREMTPYWYCRLALYIGEIKSQKWWKEYFANYFSGDQEARISFIKFSQNTMTLGYPSKEDTDKILTYEHKGIEIQTGNPEWGAEPDKLYFVIKHGKLLNN
jgi:hypothetical protein